MRKKVILPFDDKPIPVMYHNLAFPMGIIQGNAKTDITPWLCGKYINCYFDPKSPKNKFNICISDNWTITEKIIFKQSIAIDRELFSDLHFDIVTLLRKMLSCGHYVHGSYNEEYIPGKYSYQKEYFAHDFLLIGYNDISKCFSSVGYLKDGLFQRYEIPYENMLNSMITMKRERFEFNFRTYNQDAEYSINLECIKENITDYIQSENNLKQYQGDKSYGLESLKTLSEFFVQEAEQSKWVDSRYTRGLMEHKYFMRMRIDYLLLNRYINDESYLQLAQEVYNISERIHMLGLKIKMTGNISPVYKINEYMAIMNSIEHEYLPKVLRELEGYIDSKSEVVI